MKFKYLSNVVKCAIVLLTSLFFFSISGCQSLDHEHQNSSEEENRTHFTATDQENDSSQNKNDNNEESQDRADTEESVLEEGETEEAREDMGVTEEDEDKENQSLSQAEPLDLAWIDHYLNDETEDFQEAPERYEIFFKEFIEKYRFRYPLFMGRIKTAGVAQFDDNLFLEIDDERFSDAASIYGYLLEIYDPENKHMKALQDAKTFRDHDGKTYVIAADAPFNLEGLSEASLEVSQDERRAVISYPLLDPSPLANNKTQMAYLFLEKRAERWLIVDDRYKRDETAKK